MHLILLLEFKAREDITDTKKRYQRGKNDAYAISKDDIELLLEHCQICIVNRQNITHAILHSIASLDVNEQVKADLIDMRTKPDAFYV